jgi:hypothetical protein
MISVASAPIDFLGSWVEFSIEEPSGCLDFFYEPILAPPTVLEGRSNFRGVFSRKAFPTTTVARIVNITRCCSDWMNLMGHKCENFVPSYRLPTLQTPHPYMLRLHP